MSVQLKWDQRYIDAKITDTSACNALTENSDLLPSHGDALDLACGLGGNAIFLAHHGLSVCAWDISPVAIGKLADYAAANKLNILADVRDIDLNPPEPQTFDIITVSYFLNRRLLPQLNHALRPNGLIFYQTFTDQNLSSQGPKSPDYLLRPNELLSAFSTLELRAYHEPGLAGNIHTGLRGQAWLIAQKIAS